MMIISLIVALTINHIIGKNNMIPWYLPMDLRWFKYHTLNKPIIMGRKTFESIGCKPLLNRFNIVLSRYQHLYGNNHVFDGEFFVVNNIVDAMCLTRDFKEIMIIGGESVYNTFLPWSNRLYLTYINTTAIHGDVYFPKYDYIGQWVPVFNMYYRSDKNCIYDLNFRILERR